ESRRRAAVPAQVRAAAPARDFEWTDVAPRPGLRTGSVARHPRLAHGGESVSDSTLSALTLIKGRTRRKQRHQRRALRRLGILPPICWHHGDALDDRGIPIHLVEDSLQ